MGVALFPSHQSNQLYHIRGALVTGDLVHALDLEAVDDVLKNPLVGEVAEVLEYHAHLVAADVPELLLVHSEDVLAVYHYLPAAGFDEAAKATDQCRLAAAG